MESCTRLTAAEGGARLAAAAGTKNVMITEHTNFIPTSLLIECAHAIRGSLSAGYKRSVYVARASRVACVAHELKILTDLPVAEAKVADDVQDWPQELEEKQVIVCTSSVLEHILRSDLLKMTDINVLIVDSCHLIFRDKHLQCIMKLYKDCDVNKRPRILAMTYPLFQSAKDNEIECTPSIDNNDVENLNNDGNLNQCAITNDENEANDKTNDALVSNNHEKDDCVINHDDSEKNDHNLLRDNNDSSNESVECNKNADLSPDDAKTLKKDLNSIDELQDMITGDTENTDKPIKTDDATNDGEVLENSLCTVNLNTENYENNDSNAICIGNPTETKDNKLSNDDSEVRTTQEMNSYENLDDFEMYEKLEWRIEEMEQRLCCEMDLAEDIDGGKRLSPSSTKPKEVIVEYGSVCENLSDTHKELESFMRDTIHDAMEFIYEHRYDPTEIYGEELYEEFMNIPNPSIEPKQIFYQFLYVLDELGPYAADKAAFSLLIHLEKLKIKVPYERHFLLLCLCTSVFVKIRCYTDLIFSKYESDWERLANFSTPKVLRFAAILEQFKPENDLKERKKIDDVKNSDQAIVLKDNDNMGDEINNDLPRDIDKDDDAKIDEIQTIHNENRDSELHKSLNNDNNTINNTKYNDSDFNNDITIPNITNDNQIIIEKTKDSLKRSRTTELLDEINECNFTSLGDKIEDKVNIIEMNLKDIDDPMEDIINIVRNDNQNKVSEDTNKAILQQKENVYNLDVGNIIQSSENNKQSYNENMPKYAEIHDEINIKDGSDQKENSQVKGKSEKNDIALRNVQKDDTNEKQGKLSSEVVPKNIANKQNDIDNVTIDTDDSNHENKKIKKYSDDVNKVTNINTITEKQVEYNKDRSNEENKSNNVLKNSSDVGTYDEVKNSNDTITDNKVPNSGDINNDLKTSSDTVTASEIKNSYDIETASDTKNSNDTAYNLKNSDDTASNLKNSDDTASNLKNIDDTANKLENSDDTANKLKNSDDTANKLKNIDDTANKLENSDDTANKLKNSDDTANKLKNIDDTANKLENSDDTANKLKNNVDTANNLQNNVDTANKLKNSDTVTANEVKNTSNTVVDVKNIRGQEHRGYKRGRGRGRRRQNPKMQPQSSESLCGIVFVREPLMAKIMFMVIVDMSRSRPSLAHICAQYCAAESAEDPRESLRQGRKQEDVLKKFRMHECNLLLATSELEEGIDLPRCNLVVRWDLPTSYRSYGLCRCRARASKSSVTLLANAERHTSLILHNLAVYKELDQIVTRKCGCGIQDEPPVEEEYEADLYTQCIKAYTPNDDKTNRNDDENKHIIDKINDLYKSIENIKEEKDKIERNDENTTLDTVGMNTKVKSLDNVANDSKHLKDIEVSDENIESENIDEVQESKSIDDLIDSKQNETDFEDNKDLVKSEVIQKSEVLVNCESNYSLDFRDDKSDLNTDTVMKSDSTINIVSESDVKGTGSENKVCQNEVKISYQVDKKCQEGIAKVDLNSAIALINRYCGKLPSDTFTRLAPQWWMEEVRLPAGGGMRTAYICTLRMPLNCPVKYNIVGHPMPTRVLARRMVALQTCRILHKAGELDDQLMPIGKENFKAAEMEASVHPEFPEGGDSARPGTTKRRQYYYKRTAWAFTDCQPIIDTSDAEIEANPVPLCKPMRSSGTKRNMLYAIVSNLWCALPERYNTRGRRLHLPQHATQAIGILVARCEPTKLQIPAFPVYTRSGEVRVSVEPALDADVRLSPRRAKLIRRFMRFIFSDVLRVRRRGMRLQADGSTQNNYYVVPTVKRTTADGSTIVDIDWSFLNLIFQHTEEKKIKEQENPATWEKKEKGPKMENPLLKPGEVFVFDAEKYSEAVVTPWYRNQDQPQFFLVAEICWHLSPDSTFPSDQHATFRSYYNAKYGAELTQTDQPLLDVDHTSARLNLLTPRYVNRKGVALPVSSERTRRAKRDRLDQKQIMVPELCRVHPFAAPLWAAAVALPCVLYRINALLIADEIRRAVAVDVGLGIPRIDDGFTWPALDFGWSLAEVLNADSEKHDKKKEMDDSSKSDDLEKEQRDKEEQENSEKTEEESQEPKEKTINDILQEKEEAQSGFEIGTWSNEMASSIPPDADFDELLEPLPPNLTFCTSATGGANWTDPIPDPIDKPKRFNAGRKFSMADSDCSYLSSDFDTDDSDFNSDGSDEDSEGFSTTAMGVRIEYKTAHEAEAVDVARGGPLAPAPAADRADDGRDRAACRAALRAGQPPEEHVKKFRNSVELHKRRIVENGHFITKNKPVKDLLPETRNDVNDVSSKNIILDVKEDIASRKDDKTVGDDIIVDNCLKSDVKNVNYEVNNDSVIENVNVDLIIDDSEAKKAEDDENTYKTVKILNTCLKDEILNGNEMKCSIELKSKEYGENIKENGGNKIVMEEKVKLIENTDTKLIIDNRIAELFPYLNGIDTDNGQITLETIEKNKRRLLSELKETLTDEEIKKLNCFSMVDVDIDAPDYVNEKIANVGFDSKEKYDELVGKWGEASELKPYYQDNKGQSGNDFDFDYQPSLEGHPGPSPSVILQALTMSNANDGINLERLETIGDSFLKFAITAYLYCAHPAVHEGKLSHMRSKQVSNLNLYRLGRNKRLGARMIASKFEPHDNWLPPCHRPPPTLQPGSSNDQEESEKKLPIENTGCFIPYNLITQHSIPDKSIADCVEALIGAYLLECGPRGALLFMSWLGIRVLPSHLLQLPSDHPYVLRQGRQQASSVEEKPPQKTYEPLSSDSESCCSSDDEAAPDLQPPPEDWSWPGRPVGSLRPYRDLNGQWVQPVFGELKAPPSPLLRHIPDPEGELEQMLSGYEELERTLQYRFQDRSLLLQALTHASHQKNRLTDCYQRLEFLGDAILDYLITRHLYEDPRRHSPGALTDLRSALVNNTIFATLAARHGFHKYFRHMSPGLNEVLTKYVKIQEENGHSISEEHYLIQEDEMEQAEDVEVPKALGDLFESVAGAIFLDSGMSLGAVWKSYARLMMAELEAFSAAAPKSPVRELLEAEPDTAKFGKPERLADGRRVRVCVEVFGRGTFKGIGRNYRIAKGTAARCALRHLKIHRR